jgi:hypothetical protein
MVTNHEFGGFPFRITMEVGSCSQCLIEYYLDYDPSLNYIFGTSGRVEDISFSAGLSGDPIEGLFYSFENVAANFRSPDAVQPVTFYASAAEIYSSTSPAYLSELWSGPYTPPNGATLHGTGLSLSRTELTLTSLTPEVFTFNDDGVEVIDAIYLNFAFDLAVYAVPEPSSLWSLALSGWALGVVGIRSRFTLLD